MSDVIFYTRKRLHECDYTDVSGDLDSTIQNLQNIRNEYPDQKIEIDFDDSETDYCEVQFYLMVPETKEERIRREAHLAERQALMKARRKAEYENLKKEFES